MNDQYEDDDPSNADAFGSATLAHSFAAESLASKAQLKQPNGPPRIFLMGPKKSGKSSIQRIVFQKMSPHETLFLEPTSAIRVRPINNNALVQFEIVDFPGGHNFEENNKVSPKDLFSRPGIVVFVIDGQQADKDDGSHMETIQQFTYIARTVHEINPNILFDVLIHKIDGDSYITDEHKIDCQREIQQQITAELNESKLSMIHPRFYLTSIYDHTIFEAFSKITQKLIASLGHLENLLDSLIQTCGIEKAFLFDVLSKIYVATDSNPVDMQIYELCSDMIDVVLDVSSIYGAKDKPDANTAQADASSVIRLSTNYVLYLREVDRNLALVCLVKSEVFNKSGLVEYNIGQFKQGISNVFKQNTVTSDRLSLGPNRKLSSSAKNT